jgi:hypothetical protein
MKEYSRVSATGSFEGAMMTDGCQIYSKPGMAPDEILSTNKRLAEAYQSRLVVKQGKK